MHKMYYNTSTFKEAMISDEFLRLIKTRNENKDNKPFYTFLNPLVKQAIPSETTLPHIPELLIEVNNEANNNISLDNITEVEIMDDLVSTTENINQVTEHSEVIVQTGNEIRTTEIMVSREYYLNCSNFKSQLMDQYLMKSHRGLLLNYIPWIKNTSEEFGNNQARKRPIKSKFMNNLYKRIKKSCTMDNKQIKETPPIKHRKLEKRQLALTYNCTAIKYKRNDVRNSLENCVTTREFFNKYNIDKEEIIIEMPMLFIENLGDTYNVSHNPKRNTRCKFKTSMQVYFYGDGDRSKLDNVK